MNLNRPVAKRATVGVIILDFEKPAREALGYLATHLNLVQKAIEFQLVPLCPGTDLESLLSSSVANHKNVAGLIPDFRMEQSAYLKRADRAYELSGDVPENFVIVSLSRWLDNYYSVEFDGVAVIGLGHWKRQMSPPSVVEIALSIVLVTALRIALPSSPNSHMGTKGCLFDFNADVSDVRLKVLNAHICADCCQSFATGGHAELAVELTAALDGKWLGSLSDGTSPASICKKLGYDLFRTKGLSPTFWETLVATLRTDSAKTVVQIITTIILGLLGLGILAKG